MSDSWYETHKETLAAAVSAVRTRECWSAYPEVPSGKIYGADAKADGLSAFESRLNRPFEIDQPGTVGTCGDEQSPYGPKLGVSYPRADIEKLLSAVRAASRRWADATIEARAGVCLEILHRLNKQSFELANAVMHTAGQGFMMAFQAGGPHAQDRGLEAVACAFEALKRCPTKATWKKQVSKTDFLVLEKRYRIVPRGIGVVVGCSTFPTWNAYPALFANLMTGNAVVMKPHPGAILPVAVTVETARAVLRDAGFDPNLVTLVADTADAPLTKDLLQRSEVGIIDYTGGSAFGEWVEVECRHAVCYTEKAGVNSVIIDSVDDLKPMAANLAFSLCLYSGQMCTSPQNIFIPAAGIDEAGERRTFDQVADAIVGAVDGLLGDPGRASEILGAIQNEATVARIEQAGGADVVRKSTAVPNERYPDARARTPLILRVDSSRRDLFGQEMFGPISYLVATRDSAESLSLASDIARENGAITGAVYSTDASFIKQSEEELTAAGIALSFNLTGQIFVNQAAAFSDFHVSGLNPAGNATLCDEAFIANRFRTVQSRAPKTDRAGGA